MKPGLLYTVGHSNRSLDEFVSLINAYGIQALADIRSMPGSRRLPHFNAETLEIELPKNGIEYLRFKILGGRRKASKDSPNTGWQHPAFRGYADYMATPEFADGMRQLLDQAGKKQLTVMCAEALPWRCHRNLVADAAVLLYGWEVRHIMTEKKYDVHKPKSFAEVCDGHLEYPADDLFSDAK